MASCFSTMWFYHNLANLLLIDIWVIINTLYVVFMHLAVYLYNSSVYG